MSKWNEMTLADAVLERNGIKTGPFGTVLRAAEYAVSGVPVISVGEIGYGDFRIRAETPRVGRSVTSRLPEYVLQEGDIVFGRKGAVDRSAWVSPNEAGWFLGSDGLRVRAKPGVDSRFIAFQLRSQKSRDWLLRHAGGSTLLSLNQGTLGSIPILLPPFGEQQAIAEVLGALDDKIAANSKKIDLLLAIVNLELERLFGDRSLTVALGTLAEVVDCLHSKKPERLPHGETLMQLNNIRDDGLVDPTSSYCISAGDYFEWSRRFETRPWDFVITNVGRIGAVARIPNGYVAALGRNMTGIRPKDAAESGSFIAAALLSRSVRQEIEQRTDAGSVMNALNVRSVPLLRLHESSPRERRKFHEFASPFFENADLTLAENRTLAATRDALLPQLMSGKLRIRDVEHAVSEVGA